MRVASHHTMPASAMSAAAMTSAARSTRRSGMAGPGASVTANGLLDEPDFPEDRLGRGDLGGELGLERVAREPGIDPALAFERLLPGIRVHHRLDIGGDRRDLFVGEAGGGR